MTILGIFLRNINARLNSVYKWYINYIMNVFEFDQEKSKSNLDKHDIDFIQAQVIWDDPDFVEVQVKSDDEARYIIIGLIGEKYWSAIVTYRDQNIRLISVRRSRRSEVEIYES